MKYRIILAVVLFLVSCKKQEIETIPESNTPVFYMDGTWAGQHINFTAGDDGMVMNYGTETRNGVHYSFGEITNGLNSIKLGVFDGHVALETFAGNIKIGDTLYMSSKFTENLANLWKGNFANDMSISNVDWYVNGIFKGSNQVFIDEPGVYEICGNFTFSNGDSRNVCNTMYLGFQQDLNFAIRHFIADNGDVKLWLDGDLQNFDQVDWYIDDSLVACSPNFSGNIGANQREISAIVHHHNGAVLKKNIVVDGTFSGNFVEDFDINKLVVTGTNWDYGVGLEVTRNGEKFSSFEVANYKSKLVVKEMSIFETNAQGQIVVRINAEVDAKLKSLQSGNTVNMSFNSFFAIPIQN
ncbi:MAG: hypothetical protein WC044_02235 [Crocinitomicaceae bacterium]